MFDMREFDNNSFLKNIIKFRAKEKLEEFRQYTAEIEHKFKSDKNKLSSSYNEAIEDVSDEEINHINNYFSDDYYMIEEIHIGMYRKATLVSLYSFLENTMNHLCKHLCSLNNYPVKTNDLRGEGIVRSKIYLEKLANINFDVLNGEWSDLIIFNKIRNCIVHCDGNIASSKNKNKLLSIINNHPNLSLKNGRYIKIEREFIDTYITKVEKFINDLHQQAFPN